MGHPTYSSPFLACVQKLVQERPANLPLRVLAAECNVSRAWLSSFACGHMDGVSAVVAERIYTRLSGKPLVETCVPEHTE